MLHINSNCEKYYIKLFLLQLKIVFCNCIIASIVYKIISFYTKYSIANITNLHQSRRIEIKSKWNLFGNTNIIDIDMTMI